jgi:hypothetical protein
MIVSKAWPDFGIFKNFGPEAVKATLRFKAVRNSAISMSPKHAKSTV